MEDPVIAWCPGHISGYFKPVYGDLKRTGSLGAGLVIDQGVSSEVRIADVTEVQVYRVNGSGWVIERRREISSDRVPGRPPRCSCGGHHDVSVSPSLPDSD